MTKHYWGIRPKRMPDHVRIEHAETPQEAGRLAFGRGLVNFQYKDFGIRVRNIQSTSKRVAMIKNENGWIDFKQATGRPLLIAEGEGEPYHPDHAQPGGGTVVHTADPRTQSPRLINPKITAIISLIKDARECIRQYDEREGNSALLDEAESSLDAALLSLEQFP